jgi:hypothetical protein
MLCAAAQSQRRSPVKHRHLRNQSHKARHQAAYGCKPLNPKEKYFEKKFKVFVTRFS